MDDTPNTIIYITSMMVINITIFLTAWVNLKSEIVKKSSELKTHAQLGFERMNGQLSYLVDSMEFPVCVKRACIEKGRVFFRMSCMNEHYAKKVGIAEVDFVGKTDLEAGVDKNLADAIERSDLEVWQSRMNKTFIDEMPNDSRHVNRRILYRSKSGTPLGILQYGKQIDCSLDPEIQL